jgi:hypothetical protein
MPMKSSWLLRLPDIRQDVAALDVPVVDRILFEKLFHVRRRRAIAIMNVFGSYQLGQALLIDRAELLRQLEALEAGAEFAISQRRRQRLVDSLEKMRRHRTAVAVHIPVENPAAARSVTSLPDGVCLRTDGLRLDFNGAEDCLCKLFEVARAIADDFESFRALVEQPDPGPAPMSSHGPCG